MRARRPADAPFVRDNLCKADLPWSGMQFSENSDTNPRRLFLGLDEILDSCGRSPRSSLESTYAPGVPTLQDAKVEPSCSDLQKKISAAVDIYPFFFLFYRSVLHLLSFSFSFPSGYPESATATGQEQCRPPSPAGPARIAHLAYKTDRTGCATPDAENLGPPRVECQGRPPPKHLRGRQPDLHARKLV